MAWKLKLLFSYVGCQKRSKKKFNFSSMCMYGVSNFVNNNLLNLIFLLLLPICMREWASEREKPPFFAPRILSSTAIATTTAKKNLIKNHYGKSCPIYNNMQIKLYIKENFNKKSKKKKFMNFMSTPKIYHFSPHYFRIFGYSESKKEEN